MFEQNNKNQKVLFEKIEKLEEEQKAFVGELAESIFVIDKEELGRGDFAYVNLAKLLSHYCVKVIEWEKILRHYPADKAKKFIDREIEFLWKNIGEPHIV